MIPAQKIMPTRKSAQCALLLGALLFSHAAIAEPIPVQSKTFAELATYPQHSAPAEVVSDNDSRISAELTARIISLPVRLGDSVLKGALLLQLNRQDAELSLTREKAVLAAIKARLELARYELKRALTLSKKQAVSEQLLKQRESKRDALLAEQQGQQAAVAQARRQLDKTQIRAPFNAVILERIAQVGELASPGTALLRIIDIDNLELVAKVQATQAEDLQQNTSPTFSYAGQQFPLTLRNITPALDTQARTREARLRFTGQPPLPGATGKLLWSPAQGRLPTEYLSQRNGKLGVFIREADKARFVPLPKAQSGRPAALGLTPNTVIITDGRYRLRDGDTVNLVGTAP
jgi:membrane fusion protein, multidrug efflux system